MKSVKSFIILDILFRSTNVGAISKHYRQIFDVHTGSAPQQSSGLVAALSESGYRMVADLESNSDMQQFIRRVLHSRGLWVIPEAQPSLNELVSRYNGLAGSQGYASLLAEIESGNLTWASKERDPVYWSENARKGSSGKTTCYVDQQTRGTTMSAAKASCDTDFECTFIWSSNCKANAWVPCFINVGDYSAVAIDEASSCSWPKLTYDEYLLDSREEILFDEMFENRDDPDSDSEPLATPPDEDTSDLSQVGFVQVPLRDASVTKSSLGEPVSSEDAEDAPVASGSLVDAPVVDTALESVASGPAQVPLANGSDAEPVLDTNTLSIAQEAVASSSVAEPVLDNSVLGFPQVTVANGSFVGGALNDSDQAEGIEGLSVPVANDSIVNGSIVEPLPMGNDSVMSDSVDEAVPPLTNDSVMNGSVSEAMQKPSPSMFSWFGNVFSR